MDVKVGLHIAPGESSSVRVFRDGENEGWASGNWGRKQSEGIPVLSFFGPPLCARCAVSYQTMNKQNIILDKKINDTETQVTDKHQDNPFERRSSLSRTPPRRTWSVPDLSPTDIDRQTPAKRKRTDGPFFCKSDQNTGEIIRDIVRKLELNAKALSRTVNESSNTKKEIREISAKLLRLTEQLTGCEVQKALRGLLNEPETDPTRLQSRATNTSDAQTQTELINADIQMMESSPDTIKLTEQEVIGAIKEELDRTALKALLDQDWEDECYTHTILSKSGANDVTKQTDIAIFLDPSIAAKSKVIRKVAELVPEIRTLAVDNKPEPQKLAYIESNSKLILEEHSDPHEEKKCTFLVGTDDHKENEDGLYELYLATKKLAREAERRS